MNHKHQNQSPVLRKKQLHERGFALIVTLSLMILLTVVAIGLLTLSSISLRASSPREYQAQARANARMALMLAIGELQKQLGPDQRVNVPASQLSDSTGAGTTAAAGKMLWTGVYDSWNSVTTEQRPSPVFRKWLVSGDESSLASKDAPTSTSGQDITLWRGNQSDGSDKIAVASQELKTGTSTAVNGRYAWWVGDENSKALIRRDATENNLANTWSRPQAIASNAYNRNASLSTLNRTASNLDLLVSQQTLDLATATPGTANKVQADFTTNSKGVIADVAIGGLKRDMNLFLDHPISKPVATKLPNDTAVAPGDATWEELWVYHNLWRALESPASGVISKSGGNLNNTQILQTSGGVAAASISGFANDPFSMYKLPTILRVQSLLSIWSELRAPGSYNLFWVTDGILTLWNPSDVPIALHPDSYMSIKAWFIPYVITLSADGQQIAQADINQASGGQSSNLSMAFGTGPSHWPRNGTPDPVVLMPGEVLVMSEGPGTGSPRPWVSEIDSKKALNLAMKAGWNNGVGFSIPVVKDVKAKIPDPIAVKAGTSITFTAVPSTWQPASKSLTRFDSYYGPERRNQVELKELHEVLGGISIVAPTGNATNYPKLFPNLAGTFPTVERLTGAGKFPFFIFSHQVKTEGSPTAWSRTFNPKQLDASLKKIDDPELALSGTEVVIKALNGSTNSNIPQVSANNRGLFGGSYTDPQIGQDTVVTQSIPREPPLSLAVFQHAIANGFTSRYENGTAIRPVTGSLPDMTRVIGNSYALPVIAPDKTTSTVGTTYRDHSYQLNRMLWDSWFLSSIVQQQSPHHSPRRTAQTVFDDFLNETNPKPLPNPLVKAWVSSPATATNALFDASGNAKAVAPDLAASMLMMEGAFNVNSTSVEAWKAILASMDKALVPVATNTNAPGSVKATPATGIAVQNLLSAFGAAGASSAEFDDTVLGTAEDKKQWRGYRNLSYPEIDALARALVVEIRKRGPFLSLSDFINRRLGTDKKLALSGPLQVALDSTVNQTIIGAALRVGQAPAGANYAFEEAAQLPKSISTPAHVLQADILTPIGSQLTVRSDTFRIRAYGETLDKSGKVLAKAWCEAVVQRVPDYLDPSEPPQAVKDNTGRSTLMPILSLPVNLNLGRQFRIESFRWLANSEI